MTSSWFDDYVCRRGRAHDRVIAAELPGVLLAVEACPGDAVSAGQVIALLESMKMEIPVIAEHAGRIREVEVAVGDHIATGDSIALLSCCAPPACREGTDGH